MALTAAGKRRKNTAQGASPGRQVGNATAPKAAKEEFSPTLASNRSWVREFQIENVPRGTKSAKAPRTNVSRTSSNVPRGTFSLWKAGSKLAQFVSAASR